MLTRPLRCVTQLGLALVSVLSPAVADAGEAPSAFTLTSPAFKSGGEIPAQNTCDGPDISPALDWHNAPATTKSFTLIVDDPDAPAGTWVHWVLYNLPGETSQLAPGTPKDDRLANRATQGLNDFDKVGYGGPCPPHGKPHRYVFKLYALDTSLDLKPRAAKADVLRAMEGHILGRAELIGTFKH